MRYTRHLIQVYQVWYTLYQRCLCTIVSWAFDPFDTHYCFFHGFDL